MVICKYFLRGNCRFGNACKNEHTYSEAAASTSILRKSNEIDTNVLVKAVIDDVEKAEKGNQWPFSCYGPFQGKPCMPGFEDKSFEEIRLEMYEAEKNGTLDLHKQQFVEHLKAIYYKRKALENPTPDTAKFLRDLFDFNPNEQNSNIFGNTNTFNNAPNTNTSFNNQPSIFGNTANIQPTGSNIFGVQPTVNSPANFQFRLPENNSIFNNAANTGLYSQNVPQQTYANTGNIFASNIQQNQPNYSNNIFNNPQNFNQNVYTNAQNSTFHSNPFLQNNQPIPMPNTGNKSMFNIPINQNANVQPTNLFDAQVQEMSQSYNQNSVFTSQIKTPTTQSLLKNNMYDPTIYSKLEDISDSDVQQYKADIFVFGKIPDKPPTLELCTR